MLETGETPSAKVVGHIDRCLSCLACMTTCPSGVHYMHLVDLARKRIAETFRRPLADRLVRRLLLAVMPSPARFGWAVRLARLARPFAGLLPASLGRMLRLVPSAAAGRPLPGGAVYPALGERRYRVALLAGCVQQVLDQAINAATIRLLTRPGLRGGGRPGGGLLRRDRPPYGPGKRRRWTRRDATCTLGDRSLRGKVSTRWSPTRRAAG